MTQRLGFAFCSDGRGRCAHLPVGNAELIRCPQFPTTLPTLDECLALPGATADTLASRLLQATHDLLQPTPVFGVAADLEARLLPRVLDQLLTGWRAQGYDLVPLGALCAAEKELLTSYSASVDVQDLAARLVFGREVRVRDLITHRFPLEQAAQALKVAAQPAPGTLKVMLEPDARDGAPDGSLEGRGRSR